MELGPIGDGDQLVVGTEYGAEAPQGGGGQSSGHMHERDRGWKERQEEQRRPQETKN